MDRSPSPHSITFDIVRHDTHDWRVSINGADEPISFASRDFCAAASRVRARQHHLDHGVSTCVRATRSDGSMETLVWYPVPEVFPGLIAHSTASQKLRWACDQYGRPRTARAF